MELSWADLAGMAMAKPFETIILICGLIAMALIKKEMFAMAGAGKGESALERLLGNIDKNGSDAAEMFSKNLTYFEAVKDDTRRMVESLADIQRNTATTMEIARRVEIESARYGVRK